MNVCVDNRQTRLTILGPSITFEMENICVARGISLLDAPSFIFRLITI